MCVCVYVCVDGVITVENYLKLTLLPDRMEIFDHKCDILKLPTYKALSEDSHGSLSLESPLRRSQM